MGDVRNEDVPGQKIAKSNVRGGRTGGPAGMCGLYGGLYGSYGERGQRSQAGDGFMRRLWKLTDAHAMEKAAMLECWKASCKRKITVRTKYIWGRRLMWPG